MSTLLIDHNLILQMWSDPHFWEWVPELETDREAAEAEVAWAAETQSSLSIKQGELYNAWMRRLGRWARESPTRLQPMIDYIRAQRGRQDEDLLLKLRPGRNAICISKGVENHDTTSATDPIRP